MQNGVEIWLGVIIYPKSLPILDGEGYFFGKKYGKETS